MGGGGGGGMDPELMAHMNGSCGGPYAGWPLHMIPGGGGGHGHGHDYGHGGHGGHGHGHGQGGYDDFDDGGFGF
ncbi:hypothetical protein LTR49_012329 [Elasticomyces elasticus]|nr:hypothetical protein LTR49_012329 [Elasticomyces elasticus]